MYSSRMRYAAVTAGIGGVVFPGGVYPGGCLPEGCLSRGVCIPACTEAHTPPTEFLTHACENITFPQAMLWKVNIANHE